MDYDQAAQRIIDLMRADVKSDPRTLEAATLAIEVLKDFLKNTQSITESLRTIANN